MNTLNTIGILTKPDVPSIIPLVQDLTTWLHQQGKQVMLSVHTAKMLGESPVHTDAQLAAKAELVLVLGGDGTMLRAARLVEERSVPILGINLGGLGFLTEATAEDMYTALKKVFAHAYHLDIRLRLYTEISRDGQISTQATALNDIVVSKGDLARMIRIQIWVDGKFVTNLRGDGVIFSTPTGSTAYSLSAGGPILEPSLASLVITPISPHTLTHRPLIVPSEVRLEAHLMNQEGAMLTLDGQVGVELNPGDLISVRASHHYTRLVRFPDRTYYDTLRSKLKWGDG